MKKNVYLSEIERFISYLDKLSDAEISKLNDGIAKIQYNIVYVKKEKSENCQSAKILNIDPVEIINALENLSTRESGEEYLKDKLITRLDYEAVVKKLDIPYNKKDNINKLKDKIIEGTIGFRLRSQAIQEN